MAVAASFGGVHGLGGEDGVEHIRAVDLRAGGGGLVEGVDGGMGVLIFEARRGRFSRIERESGIRNRREGIT